MTDCPHPNCPVCREQQLLAAERERRALEASITAANPPTVRDVTRMTASDYIKYGGANQATIDALHRSGLTTPQDIKAEQMAMVSYQLPGMNRGPIPDGRAPVIPDKRVITVLCPRCARALKNCECEGDPEWARPPG